MHTHVHTLNVNVVKSNVCIVFLSPLLPIRSTTFVPGKYKAAPKSSRPFSSGNWGESNAVSRALQLGSAMKAPEPPEPDAPASKSSLVSRYVLRR